MEPITIISIVMFAAGFLGGLMNFFISNSENSLELPWWQHVILGIGASFMVPLFLNMISSDLIKDIIGSNPSTPEDSSKLFVLAGFSLVAAVSSRAFIRSLSDKVLQEVREAKSDAKVAKTQASTALDVLDEDEQDTPDMELSDEIEKSGKTTDKERAILLEMISGKYSMRSMSGLSNSTGLEKGAVNILISTLMEKGLIEQGKNSRDQLRWYPSPSGRAVASRANKANSADAKSRAAD